MLMSTKIILHGEVKKFNHTEKRIENLSSIKASLQKIREIVSTNVTQKNMKNCLWVTLTYAKTDSLLNKDCYRDFKLYNMRFQNYLVHKGFEKAEYICVIEPQGRVIEGKCVWHFHIIYIFPSKCPYIPNKDIEQLWRLGFTKTKAIRNVDNFRTISWTGTWQTFKLKMILIILIIKRL